MIHRALEDFLQNLSPKPLTAAERLDRASQEFAKKKFSRKDDLALFKTISISTANRDLKHGLESGLRQKQRAKTATLVPIPIVLRHSLLPYYSKHQF
jgi:hypothetical protein